MTLKKTDTHIIIIHKIVGHDPVVHDLGDMSVETAIMLEAHHLQHLADKLGQDGITGIDKITKDRTNYSWLIRAYKTAEAHNPPLANGFGNLTTYGADLATTAGVVMDKLYQADPSYANPHNLGSLDLFPNPDEWFIQARLPLRAFRMLRMMDRLIESANFMQLHSPPTKNDDWDTVVKRVKASTSATTSPKLTTLDLPFEPLSPYEEDMQTQEPQKLETVTIPLISPIDNNQPKWTPVVPTGLLAPRGRRDLKQLILLGLVDLRIIRHGGRGRPKQAMMVSPVGQKLARHEIFSDIG